MAFDLQSDTPVFVVGAGIMGAGIAQVAAQAGHPVQLFDARDGAADGARAKLASTLDGLAAKGKLDAGEASAIARSDRERGAARRRRERGAVVVEAIVENVDAKRALFRDLEAIVGERTHPRVQHVVDLDHRARQRTCSRPAGSSACTSSTRCR